MKKEIAKKIIFYLAFVVFVFAICVLITGCASPMYRTPCTPENHLVEEEVAEKLLKGKSGGDIITCPESGCKKTFPADFLRKEKKKKNGKFGWHGTGYYWGPYRHIDYHSVDCSCDDCCE